MSLNLKKMKIKYFDIQNQEKYNLGDLVESDIKNGYNPFAMKKIQAYNPILSNFLNITVEESNDYSFYTDYQYVHKQCVQHSVTEEQIEKPIFIKFSPLLDPIQYLSGSYQDVYGSDIELPAKENTSIQVHPKLLNEMNTAYIDAFFYYLSDRLMTTHQCKHGISFYGTYTCIQSQFKMNIADDYSYLIQQPFFLKEKNNLFVYDEVPIGEYYGNGSRPFREKIMIHDEDNVELNTLDFEEVLPNANESSMNHTLELVEHTIEGDDIDANDSIELIAYNQSSDSSDSSDDEDDDEENEIKADADADETKEESEKSTNDNRMDPTHSDKDSNHDSDNDEETEYTDVTTSDEEEDEEEEEYEKQILPIYISNFPVQMICLDKCENTFDHLLNSGEVSCETGASILFQVIMILLIYQKAFYFTHNDLHTDNIMYVSTDIPYLYYKYKNVYYKVPTYGKIFKIIDFGRSIYRIHNKTYYSDSFEKNGDAHTQYNFGSFMNKNKPRIEPNYSFDLCRLGCCVFESILDYDIHESKMDLFQKLINTWCLDDNKKHVLYKENGVERYPNFKLYKMIAKTVHKHTPHTQLSNPLFKAFLCKSADVNIEDVMDIDKMPCYATMSSK